MTSITHTKQMKLLNAITAVDDLTGFEEWMELDPLTGQFWKTA
jgi:hypothetical protein